MLKVLPCRRGGGQGGTDGGLPGLGSGIQGEAGGCHRPCECSCGRPGRSSLTPFSVRLVLATGDRARSSGRRSGCPADRRRLSAGVAAACHCCPRLSPVQLPVPRCGCLPSCAVGAAAAGGPPLFESLCWWAPAPPGWRGRRRHGGCGCMGSGDGGRLHASGRAAQVSSERRRVR